MLRGVVYHALFIQNLDFMLLILAQRNSSGITNRLIYVCSPVTFE
ncbi:hypothetical protein AQPE_2545 [Aquipluma nitroreducens]|uniref:Uncharacterized protein n=1 Tax=Aquipluma nitroreducens TaxID=2010828 RepID=A0A5K7S9X3_9BACT|nr:hypothetical protein AQPE_2545 [Aquipluma nitroreducens]